MHGFAAVSLFGVVRATKIGLDMKYDSIITYTGEIKLSDNDTVI